MGAHASQGVGVHHVSIDRRRVIKHVYRQAYLAILAHSYGCLLTCLLACWISTGPGQTAQDWRSVRPWSTPELRSGSTATYVH